VQGYNRAVFHPRAPRILTFDGDTHVWAMDGRPLAVHPRSEGAPATKTYDYDTPLDVSADGERIAIGHIDGSVRITRLDGRGEPVILRGHAGPVLSVAFTPDGRRLASVSRDDTSARLWLVDWKELVTRLRAATTACLRPEQRVAHLGESAERARDAWRSCERRFGRAGDR
jgi:WD40 repeat protein